MVTRLGRLRGDSLRQHHVIVEAVPIPRQRIVDDEDHPELREAEKTQDLAAPRDRLAVEVDVVMSHQVPH